MSISIAAYESMIEKLADCQSDLAAERARAETLKQQAEIWAQEARTQKATVHEIYQLCTGSTGEPGDWNGANPVREVIARAEKAEAERESAHAAQRHAENELSQYMAWYAMAEHQHLHEQRRAEKAEAERDALRKLVTLMQQRAKGGFRAWDADKDAKAGKVLAALAGMRPGYWPDMDELRAALAQEGGR